MKANHNYHFRGFRVWYDVSDTSKILKWKQITTLSKKTNIDSWCFRYFKDTKMKANHNVTSARPCASRDVSDTSKILKWKQITTLGRTLNSPYWCFRYFKDTKMKANHNYFWWIIWCRYDVSDTSKILKWKQITTPSITKGLLRGCFRYFKDTKMKANHNNINSTSEGITDVSDTSKILKWKQITTIWTCSSEFNRCFRYFKDTKMKANHNIRMRDSLFPADVSDTSKILKWKQITTIVPRANYSQRCFRYFKDTKMKATHNSFVKGTQHLMMFPILQRY